MHIPNGKLKEALGLVRPFVSPKFTYYVTLKTGLNGEVVLTTRNSRSVLVGSQGEQGETIHADHRVLWPLVAKAKMVRMEEAKGELLVVADGVTSRRASLDAAEVPIFEDIDPAGSASVGLASKELLAAVEATAPAISDKASP